MFVVSLMIILIIMLAVDRLHLEASSLFLKSTIFLSIASRSESVSHILNSVYSLSLTR